MTISQYYIRINSSYKNEFDSYLRRNNISSIQKTSDFSTGILYSVSMSKQDELAVKLAFPLIGCMDFNKTLDKQLTAKR